MLNTCVQSLHVGELFYISLSVYILKVKGTEDIPDYVQLRDDSFTLLAYFRVDRPEKALVKAGLAGKEEKVMKIIQEMPFGKVQKLTIED